MGFIEVILPKMGESVAEATITAWLKKEGDKIEEEETIVEIATDKVDSEVPSPTKGIIKEIKFKEGEIAKVGDIIAIINTNDESKATEKQIPTTTLNTPREELKPIKNIIAKQDFSNTSKFYSPLVKNIAEKENISTKELGNIKGSGQKGRVTKHDIIEYISNKNTFENKPITMVKSKTPPINVSNNNNLEIIEMDRMRKIIAKNMLESKRISPHVTSFVEADLTTIVNWRNKIKNSFEKREKEKITFTPIFIEAIVKAIKDFPMINISVDGDNIIKKKNINIGMATALPNGNLILPVIHKADELNLVGLAKRVNLLAQKARTNKLSPDDISGGTYSISNVGSFGNVMGTPIIPQPQVAILAVGAIRKKPAVIETLEGDTIGVRHMMFLSHSYDHRVVDGALGGMFVKRVADYLEKFDPNTIV